VGPEKSGNITQLLVQFRRGEQGAEARLVTLVYDELHRLAVRYMRLERKGHSLQPTALVHEAYLRLISQRPKSWKNRAHFFAVAAMLMRQILVDHARRRLAAKRGTGKPDVNIDDPVVQMDPHMAFDSDRFEDLIAVDEAMTRLAAVNPRQGRITELRFFAGMSSNEIAEALGISQRTVEREWAAAQSWLYARLRPLA
jgi:RNA polymerase sigma-70 factor (ECF subfamily)